MKSVAVSVFLLLSALPAAAQDELVGVRVREWWARMSGVIEAEDANLGSTRLDLTDDLGLGDQNLTTELQVYLRIPVVGRFYVGWWRAHDTGSEVLSKDINFAGETFTASTRVDSELTFDVGYVTYEFALPVIPLGDLLKLELGVQVGIRGFHAAASISDSGQSASDSGTAGLPVLGGHVTLRLFDLVRAEVEVVGLAFKSGDNEVHYLEMFAEAVVDPLPWIFAGVGYKLASINLQHDGSDRFKVNMDIAGIYVTFGVRF
jgi:hypothetical protein